jgi:hypothetical protein
LEIIYFMSLFLRLCRSAAVAALLSMICPSAGMAQATAAQASLSVQGRLTVYNSVVALRGKTLNESRIIVIATSKPLTASQFQQVQKANAEETMKLDSDPSYIKASFKEDGTLRYLVGDGGGAVFSKKAEPSQSILQGKATITGDRVRGEVTLNEPGDYAKEVKLTFDLPIVTEAPTAQAAKPSASQ